VIQVILAMGNFLNNGTAKGLALGFKLNSLQKLCDVRAADNKTNLLHFIVKQLEDKFGAETLNFSQELKACKRAKTLSLSQIGGEIAELRKRLTEAENEVKNVTLMDQNDLFLDFMPQKLKRCRRRLEDLQDLLFETEKEFVAVADLFGYFFFPSLCNIFFSIVRTGNRCNRTGFLTACQGLSTL
jgi:hypothetical protein